ncbi:sugar porter family MFS transporter [Flammeovirgaceae bacterium SG7u.111]|nr:sugar porter family MFS transporter [Flammeovirgaceae bacterium SG7u.132]WPO35629.1 sugar porter family MFS transporter [Flammeovirgaceae bacterium SG7u.111]
MQPYKRNAFVYSTIVALGGFVFGLDAAVISGTVRFITQEFSLSDLQVGTAVSAPGLGVLFALPLAGYISNKFGRKKALQIVAALYLVSAVCSALAPSFVALVAARFLGGLAFCSLSLASMYIGEIAPPKWRGKLVSMNQMNIVIGLSAAYFVNYLIVQASASGATWVDTLGISKYTWRWMLGSEIIPALAWFGLLFIIPRSPSWLVYSNRIEEAKNSLRKIYPENEIAHQIQEMKDSMGSSKADESMLSQLKEILGKPMRTTLIIGATIAIVQQTTGINAILFYAPTVFEQLGIGTDAAFMQTIWVGLTGLVFTALGLLLIDKIGRRQLTIWGLVWIMLSLGLCSYGFMVARYKLSEKNITELIEIPNAERLLKIAGTEFASDTEYKNALKEVLGETDARDHSSVLLQKAAKLNPTLILTGILSFIAAFHFSVGPVLWVLLSEIFPISLRGIAIPMFALITSITSYIVQQFFPWQLTNMGGAYIFLFYAILVFVGLVVLYRYLPETKNLTIEEIQLKLKNQ